MTEPGPRAIKYGEYIGRWVRLGDGKFGQVWSVVPSDEPIVRKFGPTVVVVDGEQFHYVSVAALRHLLADEPASLFD